MKQNKSTTFNCFSPPIMLATLFIEFSLAIYTLWRYKMTGAARLIFLMLIFLGAFQLSEYFVCTGSSQLAIPWSKVGFVAITALPPLGLHLMHVLAGKKQRTLVYGTYALMAAFMALFLLATDIFSGHKCTGNYVIFQFGPNVTGLYSVYYFGLLALGIGLGLKWADNLRTVKALIIGYLVFLVPSGAVIVVSPDSRRAIPSVLCGFAILLALILALYILPKAGEHKRVDKSA